MAEKKMTPAPIDRPLSRAYLRKFLGWSTAYPPTLSDPASLRIMENAMIHRDGAVGPRPGLRPDMVLPTTGKFANFDTQIISAPEPFFSTTGVAGAAVKRYIYAVRTGRGTPEERVEFMFPRAYYDDSDPLNIVDITLYNDPVEAGFWIYSAGLPGSSTPAEKIASLSFSKDTTYVKFLQIDNKIIALSDNGEAARIFTVGAYKSALKLEAIGRDSHWTSEVDRPGRDAPIVYQHKVFNSAGELNEIAIVNAVTRDNTSDASLLYEQGGPNDPTHFMAFFYTFSNEFGEGLPSKMTRMPIKRAWSQWKWNPQIPSGATVDPEILARRGIDPEIAPDQLIVRVPINAVRKAKQLGADMCHVYAMYWNEQSPMPVEATRVSSKSVRLLDGDILMSSEPDIWEHSKVWARVTPASIIGIGGSHTPPPLSGWFDYVDSLIDYSTPPTAAQGLVASDRMVLVNDPAAGAVVRWTGNQLGSYTDFSPSVGGGYKTLTSGNLQIPACVKLWQNPQSADTLTVLCLGTDGTSSTYYMAPAQIAAQSEATNIMAFEETTATQGTTSPYGCEVFNNALYHPIGTEITKSTASNYNVNHKSQTDQIANGWKQLIDKYWIMSCELDGRIYFLVNNPSGEYIAKEGEDEILPQQGHPSRVGWRGNEVWVLDAGSEKGVWSRWLTGGVTLKKIDVDGITRMALVRPDGLYYFDEYGIDDHTSVYDGMEGNYDLRLAPFSWFIETNTQGANRAHDAWAHLQKLTLSLGNFVGTVRWGVRGIDLHGRSVDISKVYQDHNPLNPEEDLKSNIEDALQVKRDMKEWVFYAVSESTEIDGVMTPASSFGQINSVMYSYTPVSVNVGYEHGSVETFEYGHATASWGAGTTDAGVPQPYTDTSRDFGAYRSQGGSGGPIVT